MYAAWQEHRRCIAPLARQLARPGASARDLWDVGFTGLWLAARDYDPAKGVKFRTFAERRVRWAMDDYLRETFGRRSREVAKVGRLRHDHATWDKGLARVDDRDEIEHATRDPVEHPRNGAGCRRRVTWQGRTLLLKEWAAEFGMSDKTLAERVERWGLKLAFETPVIEQFRNR